MEIEVWSDVVCPWCYLGKRRLESAVAAFPQPDQIEIVWRAFELDPAAPSRQEISPLEHLSQKYGMTEDQVTASWARLTALAEAEGLEYHLDRTQRGSSFDAHRLIRLGKEHGVQDEVKERLLRAYFTECLAIGEQEVLHGLAVEAGLPAAEVADLLETDRFAESVREDERQARRLGIQGVPFFAIGGRYGVSGAQSAELLLEAISTAWSERVSAAEVITGEAGGRY